MAPDLVPHVIIMDMQMPRLSGVEATRRIKRVLPGVHVIGLSSRDDSMTKKPWKRWDRRPLSPKNAPIRCLKLLRKLLAAKADDPF